MSDEPMRGTPRLEGTDLIGDVMQEALEGSQREPERRPAPPPSQATDYYQSQIEEKRKKLRELADKIRNQESNRAYVKKDQNGGEYLDFQQMQADQASIVLLKQEIDDLREEATQRRETASARFETARQRALAFARAEAARVPDEGRRKAIAEKFIELFNGVSDGRIWERARYANPANIDADIQQLWESAVGAVTRKSWSGNGSPAPSGLDEHNEKPKEPERDEDPFTNNLMYAYERRKARSMTFAEAKAARAQAEQQRREGGQQQ